MQVDHLIVGQGICGSLLSYELMKAGSKVLVIDRPSKHSASHVASGLINPVTGKRLVKSWMIDELIPAAIKSYKALELELGAAFHLQIDLLDIFRTAEEEQLFLRRQEEDDRYLFSVNNIDELRASVDIPAGAGRIDCLLIGLHELISKWRDELISRNAFIEGDFDRQACIITADGVRYKDIEAGRIIFCEGAAAINDPLFSKLPWSLNKGEALIVSIPGLNRNMIYKSGMKIAPWKEDLFWVGASYQWEYENAAPTQTFREQAEAWLHSFLKIPFEVVDHISAERPASMDYKPFIGFHPTHHRAGIFNGMGSKACSLAPYFSKHFAAHILTGSALMPDVNVHRYSRILLR